MGQMDAIVAAGRNGNIYYYKVTKDDFVADRTDRVVYNNIIFHADFFEFISISTKENSKEIEALLRNL